MLLGFAPTDDSACRIAASLTDDSPERVTVTPAIRHKKFSKCSSCVRPQAVLTDVVEMAHVHFDAVSLDLLAVQRIVSQLGLAL